MAAKRRKLITASPVQTLGTGKVFSFGQGDCGQLGLGETILKRNYPCLISALEKTSIRQVCAGGMHTVILDDNGKVWTNGVNDDKALGRKTEEEEDQFEPGLVKLSKTIVQISTGDSHCAALTDDGDVWAWGVFKDVNGNFGLIPKTEKGKCFETPQLISAQLPEKISKICSGDNHLVMLSESGKIYTCGTGEQGQLGRVYSPPMERRVTRSSSRVGQLGHTPSPPKNEQDFLLTPTEVKIGRKKFTDIWTGSFSTYCKVEKTNDIWVFGLNNFFQLGFENKGDEQVIFKPTKSSGFVGEQEWSQIAAGQHHTIALDKNGAVYSLGRGDDGRLGLGEDITEPISVPTLIPTLKGITCVQIAAGLSTGYAITSEGVLYAWGFGGNYQLGTGNEDHLFVPQRVENMVIEKTKMGIDGRTIQVSAGGQHVLVILNRTMLNGTAKLKN